jgi:hypothetical protein
MRDTSAAEVCKGVIPRQEFLVAAGPVFAACDAGTISNKATAAIELLKTRKDFKPDSLQNDHHPRLDACEGQFL